MKLYRVLADENDQIKIDASPICPTPPRTGV
jgi:hypothetical protein